MKRLQAGEPVTVDAFDREKKVKLATGVLLTTDNQIDPATGTVKLKAQFPNDDSGLFPNQFVNVRMLLDTRRDVITIPAAAIQRGGQGTFVYTVKPDHTVGLRPVKLGSIDADNIEVDSGIAPGELVVVDGVDRLRDGAKVELVSANAAERAAAAAATTTPAGDARAHGPRRRADGAPPPR